MGKSCTNTSDQTNQNPIIEQLQHQICECQGQSVMSETPEKLQPK